MLTSFPNRKIRGLQSVAVVCMVGYLAAKTDFLTQFLYQAPVAVLDLSNWRGSAPVFCGAPKGEGF